MVQQPEEGALGVRDLSDELDRLAERLIPGRNRAEVIARMDALFAGAVAPDPPPSGFQPGRLLGTATWGPWDAVVMRIAQLWMPWLGKTFSPSTGTGLNRFTPTAATRVWLRAVFPRHAPEVNTASRLEAFPYRTLRRSRGARSGRASTEDRLRLRGQPDSHPTHPGRARPDRARPPPRKGAVPVGEPLPPDRVLLARCLTDHVWVAGEARSAGAQSCRATDSERFPLRVERTSHVRHCGRARISGRDRSSPRRPSPNDLYTCCQPTDASTRSR